MQIHILFAQRKQRYEGQYGPEALAVATEYDVDENEDYLPDTKLAHEQSGDYESLAIITFEVSDAEIMKRLRPEHKPLTAKVI